MHSYLLAEFLLKRHMGHFMINVYVPCTMLVILSWVGFWINREATGDRIALGNHGAWSVRNVWVSKAFGVSIVVIRFESKLENYLLY